MKRRWSLFVTFLLLVAGLVGLWRFRFERVSGAPPLTLSDLRAAGPTLPSGAAWTGSANHPTLLLTAVQGQPWVGVRRELPSFSAMEALHVKFRMVARNLRLGPHKWDDGRVLIEWLSSDQGRPQETDPVCSLRDHEGSGDVSLVVRASSGLSIPVLRMEHLGSSGEFEISELEMIPVKERALWKFGRWVMVVLWFGWIRVVFSGVSRPVWRVNFAAGIWLGMAIYFAIPGPWKTLRPLVVPFEVGLPVSWTPSENEPVPDRKQPRTTSKLPSAGPSPEVLGSLPLQGGWIIQVKSRLAILRPLLHSLLMFGPTLAFAWLVGRKPAIALALGLAVSIEAAQTAFGYGFDWIDVLDLFFDGLGIVLAIGVYQKVNRRFSGRLPEGLKV